MQVTSTQKSPAGSDVIALRGGNGIKSLRLLIVEDSEDDTTLLVLELKRAGYDVKYERVDTPNLMGALLANKTWDLVLADYNMPRFSGTEALKLVRERGLDLPFIFVSGTIREDTAIAAMKAGAHDYVMKGNLKRLIPAIERELAEAEVRRRRRQAERELQLRNERIQALHEINTSITSTLELPTVLATLLDKIDLLLPYSAAAIRLFDKESGFLEPVACRNLKEADWKADEWRNGRGLANAVFEAKAPIMIRNPQTDERLRDPDFYLRNGLVSYLGVPLVVKEEAIGVLGFYTRQEHEFTEGEVHFLTTLAGQASMAIYNSRLHEGTKKQAAELKKANKAKDEFLSVVSHELRTPLNVIQGYVQLMRAGKFGELAPDLQNAVTKLTRQTTRLLSMVEDILVTTRIETGTIELELSNVNLTDLLDQLKLSCDLRSRDDFRLIWNIPSELPALRTDSGKLNQILQKLVSNAIKFTEEGQVKISARHVPEVNVVEFSVEDTGIGIEPENIPLIFNMFYQVDSSDTRSYGGTGLGLFIAKKYVDLLGGSIEVKSELGVGSTFLVRMPL